MTIYRVSRDGDNSDGSTWATAYTTYAAGVAAATSDGDVVYVDKDHYEAIAANTIVAYAANVATLCVDKDSSDALAIMDGSAAWVGQSTGTGYNLTIGGAKNLFFYGLCFRTSASSTGPQLNLHSASYDGAHYRFEACTFWNGSTVARATVIGSATTNINGYIELIGCKFRWGHAGGGLSLGTKVLFEGCSVNPGGSAPTTLFASADSNATVDCHACDWSAITNTLVAAQASKARTFNFFNCQLGSGVTPLASQTYSNLSCGEVYFYNCASGDQHYHLAHYNPLGSALISTSVYVTADGASYDGTNRHSWVVDGTSSATVDMPYVSPWIDVYHDGTSAITPYLEILRSGSTTKYQDDEVWSEWSYQGTSGYPLASIVSERLAPLGTAADLTASSLGASDWTGEDASNNAYMKLQPPSSITPAEIGHMRARICVGGDYTVYVDPQIRGRS